jgi:hypothetical protein
MTKLGHKQEMLYFYGYLASTLWISRDNLHTYMLAGVVCDSVVQHVLSMLWALSLISSTAVKKGTHLLTS